MKVTFSRQTQPNDYAETNLIWFPENHLAQASKSWETNREGRNQIWNHEDTRWASRQLSTNPNGKLFGCNIVWFSHHSSSFRAWTVSRAPTLWPFAVTTEGIEEDGKAWANLFLSRNANNSLTPPWTLKEIPRGTELEKLHFEASSIVQVLLRSRPRSFRATYWDWAALTRMRAQNISLCFNQVCAVSRSNLSKLVQMYAATKPLQPGLE